MQRISQDAWLLSQGISCLSAEEFHTSWWHHQRVQAEAHLGAFTSDLLYSWLLHFSSLCWGWGHRHPKRSLSSTPGFMLFSSRLFGHIGQGYSHEWQALSRKPSLFSIYPFLKLPKIYERRENKQSRKFWRSMVVAWFSEIWSLQRLFAGLDSLKINLKYLTLIFWHLWVPWGNQATPGNMCTKAVTIFWGYVAMCSCLFKASFELWMRCRDRKPCNTIAHYVNKTHKEAPSKSELVFSLTFHGCGFSLNKHRSSCVVIWRENPVGTLLLWTISSIFLAYNFHHPHPWTFLLSPAKINPYFCCIFPDPKAIGY